jgi:hypothetical protein
MRFKWKETGRMSWLQRGPPPPPSGVPESAEIIGSERVRSQPLWSVLGTRQLRLCSLLARLGAIAFAISTLYSTKPHMGFLRPFDHVAPPYHAFPCLISPHTRYLVFPDDVAIAIDPCLSLFRFLLTYLGVD